MRILVDVVVLLVVPDLIAACAMVRSTTEHGGLSGIPAQAPAHAPILGERVTLEETQQRTPYTIPVPPTDVVGSDTREVWASEQNRVDKYMQVYIIYSNGLEISMGGAPSNPPPIDLSQLRDAFREERVGGKTDRGKDAYVKTKKKGTQVGVPASLSCWDNQAKIPLYHPTMTLQELVRIGEAMPAPTWPSS